MPPPDPQLYRDPWGKREAWRKHPVFSRRQMFARAFPGFGVALVAFTAYVIADNLLTKGKAH
ncbi:NADH-ubiquinone oxidoreductase B12 subunit family-domain-containing protein [Dichomitus squalens]|uniref:NADH-ubiquinone oxidoreductase B12 subunit family-domain-containing protein n=2 Tax=Dichomitus squalens TaxID=114155 RepID=A0A4Q9NPD5_9APHY